LLHRTIAAPRPATPGGERTRLNTATAKEPPRRHVPSPSRSPTQWTGSQSAVTRQQTLGTAIFNAPSSRRDASPGCHTSEQLSTGTRLRGHPGPDLIVEPGPCNQAAFGPSGFVTTSSGRLVDGLRAILRPRDPEGQPARDEMLSWKRDHPTDPIHMSTALAASELSPSSRRSSQLLARRMAPGYPGYALARRRRDGSRGCAGQRS
jgi:hypothetical protein